MGYFLFLLWFNSQPTHSGQPIIDSSSSIGIILFLIGVIFFLLLCFFSLITGIIFSPFIPINSIIIFSIAGMPIYGMLLGAVIGHYFEKQ
jgi:hypothetical protein